MDIQKAQQHATLCAMASLSIKCSSGTMASLSIKCSSGTKLTVTAEFTKTVGELKSQLEADVGVPPEQMRLIYAGRVLKDQQTLASYNIEDGRTVHLIQGAAAPAASITSPAQSGASAESPAGGLAALAGSMAVCGGRFILPQARVQRPELTCEMVQSLMTDEPERMQAIIEQNPRIGHVLNNPDVLREILAATRTPAHERELMRMADRAMSNIESHPQGFNMLRRMYDSVQEPLVDAASGAHNTSDASQETPAPACDPNPFAELFVVRACSNAHATMTASNMALLPCLSTSLSDAVCSNGRHRSQLQQQRTALLLLTRGPAAHFPPSPRSSTRTMRRLLKMLARRLHSSPTAQMTRSKLLWMQMRVSAGGWWSCSCISRH
jgi:hypothetical protein